MGESRQTEHDRIFDGRPWFRRRNSGKGPSMRHSPGTRVMCLLHLKECLGLESSIDNWLMIDRLSYPAEPLNAKRYRKPNEEHVGNQPQN